LVLRSRRVVTLDGLKPATIVVREGRIADIAPWNSSGDDLADLVILPGLVDTHVHVNEPGRTEWEGFHSATRAAAAGGVTTLLDMPLNSVPATTTPHALDAKREAARGKTYVDVGFLGGVVPGNAGELAALWRDGVFAFKCFLAPSGVEEFEHVSERELRDALPILANERAPLMAHAEIVHPIAAQASSSSYADYLATRPPSFETAAIDLLGRLSVQYAAHVHIVHVASRDAVRSVQRARSLGATITAETCPHYLAVDAGEIPDGATEFKCAPPIRDRGHRDALWQSLLDGDLEMIVSDHSPSPPALKCRDTGDFMHAWGGIASLQLGLRVVWTEMRERGIPIERLAEWMCRAPARLAGLEHRKGAIAVGCDADLIVFDPDAQATVAAETLLHRHPLTPYLGRTLAGTVERTYLRGRLIYHHGTIADPPIGELLSRRDHD
jgi:allantoinase